MLRTEVDLFLFHNWVFVTHRGTGYFLIFQARAALPTPRFACCDCGASCDRAVAAAIRGAILLPSPQLKVRYEVPLADIRKFNENSTKIRRSICCLGSWRSVVRTPPGAEFTVVPRGRWFEPPPGTQCSEQMSTSFCFIIGRVLRTEGQELS